MKLDFKKVFSLILILSILFLSLGSVCADSDGETLENYSSDIFVSDSNFAVNHDNIEGGFIYEDNSAIDKSNFSNNNDNLAGSSFEEDILGSEGTSSVSNNFTLENSLNSNYLNQTSSNFNSKNIMKSNTKSNKLNTIIYAQNMEKFYDDADKRFKVVLTSQDNKKLSGKQLTLQIIFSNGNICNYTRTTNDLGEAYLNINLNPNNYSIRTIFAGDSSFSSSFRTNSIIINKSKTYLFTSDMIALNSTPNKKFQVKITDSNFVPLSNQTVTISVNNVTYNKTTDSNGIATLNVNIQYFGTYAFNATFAANAKYFSS